MRALYARAVLRAVLRALLRAKERPQRRASQRPEDGAKNCGEPRVMIGCMWAARRQARPLVSNRSGAQFAGVCRSLGAAKLLRSEKFRPKSAQESCQEELDEWAKMRAPNGRSLTLAAPTVANKFSADRQQVLLSAKLNATGAFSASEHIWRHILSASLNAKSHAHSDTHTNG